MSKKLSVAVTLVLSIIIGASAARAAEIKLLSTGAYKPEVLALVPDFEKQTGHKVTVDNGTAGELKRIEGGEVFDVAVITPDVVDDLIAKGKIAAGSRVALASVGVGVVVRERLNAVGLTCFCKTTGGKGLHVVTPLSYALRDAVTWNEAKAFAKSVCAQMTADSPNRYLVNMSKSQRSRKIFLDYLRNDRKSTAVAPLSPRARAGATVSMPITWSQVKAGLEPKRFLV
jgi:hypothetical protein